MIYSFGYKHGEPPMRRVQKVFNVSEITHDVNAPEFLDTFKAIVDYGKAHPAESIAIGCEHGCHRSVVLANKVATTLRTGVYHRDR